MRKIGISDIEDIALGAALLGAGGGGDPYIGKLLAIGAVKECGEVSLIDVDELSDDDVVVPVASVGAPTILTEKGVGSNEFTKLIDMVGSYYGKKITAIMPIEAGGVNSMLPIAAAARLGLPMVDVDGMGRAFPELQMVTWSMYGQSASPIGVADERGNTLLVHAATNKCGEDLCRGATVEMGGNISLACYGMTGAEAKAHSVAGTYTLCENVGRILRRAREERSNDISELRETLGAVELFRGKVEDVERRTVGGFARGLVHLEGMDAYKGGVLDVRFQNEFLIAECNGEVVCTAPDLIAMFDSETLTPITGEALKYGCRAIVLGIPCAPQWRTPEGLATVGPAVFGYEGVEFVPVEERCKQ